MGRLNQCCACQQLTTLSPCPRCDAATTPYPTAEDSNHAASLLVDDPQHQATAELTLADIEALATSNGGSARAPHGAAQHSADELAQRVEALQYENNQLKAKLEKNRRQMLRSAMAVRQIHANTKQLRQHDHEVIDGLRRANDILQERLVKAEAVPSDAAQPTAARSSTTSPLSAPSAVAAAAPVPPLMANIPPVAAKETEKGLTNMAPLQCPTPALSLSNVEDSPALQREVQRLTSAVARKTQQLDGLWERVERAEGYILDLLAQLGYAQNLTQEETRNSARLSRHLASLGDAPVDLGAFMAIKDRHSTSGSTPASSVAPPSIAVAERT